MGLTIVHRVTTYHTMLCRDNVAHNVPYVYIQQKLSLRKVRSFLVNSDHLTSEPFYHESYPY